MTTLAELKKQSAQTLQQIIDEANKANKKFSGDDDRFWKPTITNGEGSAIIRLLPAPDGEKLPWAMYFDHAFQGPTGLWYIEKSLTTARDGFPKGTKDPVTDYNSRLWSSKDEDQIAIARRQKRRQVYVSNVLIINDLGNPDNTGKIKMWNYGKKIYEGKIKPLMFPDPKLGIPPVDPFNFWTGQNFLLRVKTVGGFRNYDESQFLGVSPVSDDDQEIERIWRSEHSLQALIAPSEFKTYDELKARFEEVTGAKVSASSDSYTSHASLPPMPKKTAAPAVPPEAPKSAPKAKSSFGLDELLEGIDGKDDD